MANYEAVKINDAAEESGVQFRNKSWCPRPILICFFLGLAVAVVVGAVIFSGLVIPIKPAKSIKIWQTSQFHGDRLNQIDAGELTKRGFDVESLTFGNSKVCNPTCDSVSDMSRMSVDSKVTYQVMCIHVCYYIIIFFCIRSQ